MTTFAQLLRDASSKVPPLDERWAARRRLARAVRRLIEATVTRSASADVCSELAQHAEALAERLERELDVRGIVANTAGGSVQRFVAVSQELNPLYGSANPLSPPLEMWRDDARAWGKVQFGWAYEGPPGHVHGGFIAAAFDQFLGFAQCIAGSAGMTGKLEVRYVRPTPIGRELTLEAHVKERTGRLTYVAARMLDGAHITAKAQCMFVDIPHGYLSR